MRRSSYLVAALVLTATTAAPSASEPLKRPSSASAGAGERAGSPLPLTDAERADLLQQHRNLGKALYENPATQYDAPAEFERALALAPDSARDRVNLGLALLRAGKTDEGVAQLRRAQEQDPSIPHTWFNLGMAYKKASDYEHAIAQLEGMLERVPDEPITHYNLGVLYKLQGDAETALHHFERAAEIDPSLTGPHFQLATAYRQAGRPEDAEREMATFRELKAKTAGDAVQEDLEWSWYAEIYDPVEPEPLAAPEARVRFEAKELAGGVDPESAGLLVLEADGDPEPELLAWSAQGVRLLRAGEAAEASGFGGLRGVRHAAAGDFDNDGRHDLALLTGRLLLLANREGRFEPIEGLPEAAKRAYDRALWLDYDHDYDLDLVLFGAEPALLRNDGPATDGGGVAWSDRTADFPFAALAGGGAATAVVRFDVVADTQGLDVAVARASAGGVLFRDLLGGHYDAAPLPGVPAATRELLAADVDHDGWTDLVAATAEAVTVLRNRHRLDAHEGFETVEVAGAGGGPVAQLDLESRGACDMVAGGRAFRDRGRASFEPGPAVPALDGAVALASLAAVEANGDGRADLAAVSADGRVLLLENRTETANGSLGVALAGVKSPKLAPGARIEVKAGGLYQKQLYDGVPLVFGLGGHESADTIRITWPNGLVQNETRKSAGTFATYEEAQRLSGSCPMIFTWNGEEFSFLTDVLGVAPLGASAGDGEYFPTDHDEAIQIPGEALVATPDGRYEVRITEELREVAFLDQVRLLAVDHEAGVDVFTNEKFQGPPFPELRLFGVAAGARRYPVAARDDRGQDVRERLLARDATYPDGFARDYAGLAELHHLDLDFGKETAQDGRAILVLSGWVDWADGSTFLASAQGDGPGLVLPYLQVKDEAGEWVTAIEDMGIPAGKPKTIVVDLTGKWRSARREIRIVTSACVYWDEIFLGSEPDAPETRLAKVPAVFAELHFRGFSRPVIHPQRKQPERFVYADRRRYTMWNPTPGLYTRYGDVADLLREVDDRFVIMGSGDEIRLAFNARALPPPPAGWRRDFLLWVDGWAKDGDANTAHSQTVGPLPYHGMPQYPYEAPNAYPDDPEHRLYREHYLTRPALRPIRPLTEGTPADPRRERAGAGAGDGAGVGVP
jgi:tetratricopeptide (TPR) repeat protein